MRYVMPCLLAILSTACAKTPPITSVRILDEHFKVAKVLSASEIADFEQAWEGKKEVGAVLQDVGGQHFKIDIERNNASSSRWLYRSTGYAQILTMKAGRPVYGLQDPEAFNALIGATK
jgi:hypothetical protein